MVPLLRKRPDPAPNDLTYTCPLCGHKIADHEILPTDADHFLCPACVEESLCPNEWAWIANFHGDLTCGH
jgi:hypothetical protein